MLKMGAFHSAYESAVCGDNRESSVMWNMMKVGGTGDKLLMVGAIIHCVQMVYGDKVGVKSCP